MAGFDLKEGTYKFADYTDSDLWSSFKRVFSSKTKNSSTYKFVFLKAIMDCLENGKTRERFDFYEIFERFTEIYWIMAVNYGLKQGTSKQRLTYVEQTLQDYAGITGEGSTTKIRFVDLNDEVRSNIVGRIVKDCKKYVVGALYSDTLEMFYSFNKKEEWIKINPVMIDFVKRHKASIEELNLYEISNFMKKANEKNVIAQVAEKIGYNLGEHSDGEILRRMLFEEFNKITNTMADINTFEILIDANSKDIDDFDSFYIKESNAIEQDKNDMMLYLDDPEKIIRMLKVRRGILC